MSGSTEIEIAAQSSRVPLHALGFRTQEHEVAIDRLPVQGNIPAWLRGTLLRNGPAKFEIGGKPLKHWFDGLAMLHKFSLRDGQVSYANRFLRSHTYQESLRTGRISAAQFASDPCRSLFRRVMSLFVPRPTDNASVSITRLANRVLAMTETPLPVEFDPRTLETVGLLNFDDKLAGHLSTAHPHYDAATGETFNYLTRFSYRSEYQVYRVASGQTRREVFSRQKTREPSYMHSFALTPRYVVLTQFPLVVRPLPALLSGKAFIENYRWQPQRGTRLLVFERDGGRLRGEYDAPPLMAFHHIDAWERGDELWMDLAAYDDASIIQSLYLDRLQAGERRYERASLRRLRLPLAGREATCDIVSSQSIELPRIDPRRQQQAYRYAYGVSIGPIGAAEFSDQLVKTDVDSGTTRTWREADCFPGEPVFVPAPDSAVEDAGVVLSVVLDGRDGCSFLLLLDASSFTEIARAAVPQHIPFGFHGDFFSDGL
ncbi:MAG: carotenoid oxygenase family protein [Pirellulales bacterium]